MDKRILLLVVLFVLVILLSSIIVFLSYDNRSVSLSLQSNNSQPTTLVTKQNNNANNSKIVGGDKNEHGCIASAGYAWCAVKNKCLRTWEEKCEADNSNNVSQNQGLQKGTANQPGLQQNQTIPNTDQNISEHNGWKTFNKNGVVFQYPEELGMQYIDTYGGYQWPPEIKVETGKLSCKQSQKEGGEDSPPETISQQVINGRAYCVDVTDDESMNQIWKHYIYTTSNNGKFITISFVLHYEVCDVYIDNTDSGQKEYEKCNKEEASFDVNSLVDQIVQTLQLNK